MNFIQSLLVIFAIIFVGIICEKRKLLNHIQIEGFEIYLFKIAMPCYLFSSILNHDLKNLIQLEYIFAYLLSFSLIALITLYYFYKQDNASQLCMKILNAGYVNTAIYILPIVTFLLDNPIAGIIANLLQVLIVQPIFIAVLSFIHHKEKSMMMKILSVISTPLVAMPIIGIICNYLQFTPPETIASAIQSLGSGASSIALFAFGLSLGSIKIIQKDFSKDLLFIVLAKNLVHPLFAFYIGKYVFSLEGYLLNALVICGSAPPAFSVYIIAKQFLIGGELTKKVIAISSVVSLISLVIIISLLKGL